MSSQTSGRLLRPLAAFCRIAAVSLSVTLLAGCGGNGVHGLTPVNGKANASLGVDSALAPKATSTTFAGTINGAPNVHRIELAAGEAVRFWARPDAGQAATGEDGPVIELGLAAIDGQPRAYLSGQTSGNETDFFSDFGSDQAEYLSDFGSVASELPDYGIFYWTQYENTADRTMSIRTQPAFFADYGRGWGPAAKSGSWMTFVAPVAGPYELIVSGSGSYHGALSTRLTKAKSAGPAKASASAFDNTGNQGAALTQGYGQEDWVAVLKDQESFLYDSGGFWPGGFLAFASDSDATLAPSVPYDPSTHKAQLDKLLQ
jgi:hypothetical protein